ncbi:MAG: hypothetical protein Q9165_006318 [Trypethelium subeluteriae]
MTLDFSLVLTALLALSATTTATSTPGGNNQSELAPYTHYNDSSALVPDSYIVKFKDNYTIEHHLDYVGVDISSMGNEYAYLDIIPGYHIKVNQSVIHDLIRKDPGVEWVEQTTFASLPQAPPANLNRTFPSSELSRRWDTAQQSGVPLPLAQQSSNGALAQNADHRYEYWHWDGAGSDVDIYILDWGVDVGHREFEGRASNFNGLNVSPYLPSPNNAMRDTSAWGHGNCIASLAAGRYSGTANRANIINVKVIDNAEQIEWHRVIQALGDVRKAHNAKRLRLRSPFAGSIVVLSLASASGLGGRPLRAAVKKMKNAGIPIVVAAGDGRRDAWDVYPCNFPDSICVSSVDRDYRRTVFSNFGKQIAVAAPGQGVACAGLGQAYTAMSGTAMSTGFVAGTLANFISYEKLHSNVGRVMRRMKNNWNEGLVISETPEDTETANTFNSNGFLKPNKNHNQPYVGAPNERRSYYHPGDI